MTDDAGTYSDAIGSLIDQTKRLAKAEAEVTRLRAVVARVDAACAEKEDAMRRANERYAERNIVDAKTGRVFQGLPILTCREIRAAMDADA